MLVNLLFAILKDASLSALKWVEGIIFTLFLLADGTDVEEAALAWMCGDEDETALV